MVRNIWKTNRYTELYSRGSGGADIVLNLPIWPVDFNRLFLFVYTFRITLHRRKSKYSKYISRRAYHTKIGITLQTYRTCRVACQAYFRLPLSFSVTS